MYLYFSIPSLWLHVQVQYVAYIPVVSQWCNGGAAVEWSGRAVECIWRRVKRDGRVDGHGEGTYLPTYLAALDDLIWERGNLPGASSSLHLCLI